MNAPAAAPGYRLDASLQVAHYDVVLDASPKRSRFQGEVRIEATLTVASARLLLHGRGLKILAATVRQGRREHQIKVRAHAAFEQLELHLAETLKPGPVRLTLRFSGKLAASMHGLYLAKDGPEVALVTQCEAADARAIFPCLDEPAFKATLQWTIHTDPGLTVVTNGRPLGKPKLQSKAEGGRAVHRFAKTAPMSTYLAALTIGHFEPGAGAKVDGVPCRIWAGRNKAAQTGFALEVTQKVLPYYVDYFGEPYAYGKLDQVAVPGFDAGAMENAGAIFYRQSLLLCVPGQTGFGAQKRIGEVIAHEIAHQWFGNLVTMQWWDDLWLNEAFATWVAFKSCNALYPSWKIWNDYLEAKESALVADALGSTHPIYAEVKTPAEATELFDVITYEKGCGVLRMAEGYLGERAFRDGIRRYIKAHRFGNAYGHDLWQALGGAAKQPVSELMQSWVTQPGFPLLTCTQKPGKGGAVLTIEQRRFAAAPAKTGAKPSKPTKADKQTWLLPLVIAYDAGEGVQTHRVLVDKARQDVELPLPAGAKLRWAYPNWEAKGFWRCQLRGNLHAAVCAAGPEGLGTAASMAMVYDAWALLRAGELDVAETMETLAAFAKSNETAVFRAVAGRLRALDRYVVRDADRKRLAALAAEMARPQLARLGWKPAANETPHDATMRCAAIDLLGHVAKDAEVLAKARELQAEEMQDPGAIEPNLAQSVVALSALGAEDAHVRRLVATYRARKQAGHSPEVQGRYLAALCCVDSPKAIEGVLALTLDGTVPQEQLRTVLASLLGGRIAGPLAWAFLRRHWKALSPKVGAMGIARLVESTGALPWKMRGELKAFFAAHPVPEAERAVRKADEVMTLWQALRRRAAGPLGDWLRARPQAAKSPTGRGRPKAATDAAGKVSATKQAKATRGAKPAKTAKTAKTAKRAKPTQRSKR